MIESLNKLIAETVIHGADAGGSYDSNWQDMKTAIYQFLDVIGIDGESYILIRHDYRKGNEIWPLPYLVKEGRESKMTWNIYWFDPNEKKFKTRNVFRLSSSFNKDFEKLKENSSLMTKQEFSEELAKITRYHYWARCEYELLLCDVPSEQVETKIDVFHQLSANWERFVDYVWENI